MSKRSYRHSLIALVGLAATVMSCSSSSRTAGVNAVDAGVPMRNPVRTADSGVAASSVASDGPSVDAVQDTAPLPDALELPPDPVIEATADAGTPARPTGPSPLDLPMAVSWQAVNQWNDAFERDYSNFVARLGRAVLERRCGRLDSCLRNPAANSLYDPAVDARISLGADCADLPYALRSYFAFKRRLPFGHVNTVTGSGRDPRYMLNVRPTVYRTWLDYPTPRSLFRHFGDELHSGMYRATPTQEDGDFYPAAMNRTAIRPGTVFYDPNGHVLVVVEVRSDGVVSMIDGHPDDSLTAKRFGQAFTVGTASLGGGFKNFRPIRWDGTHLTRARNAEIPTYGGREQFDYNRGFPMSQSPAYSAWVRSSLSLPGAATDPTTEFREQVRALCRDVTDRMDAVNFAIAANIHRRSQPSSLPDNIYGTTGDWETYSTPSRDARLKAAFRELRDTVAGFANGRVLAPQLRTAWREEAARAECRFSYTNSAGTAVNLTLDDVLDRIYNFSFDPHHCPELRWGAPENSPERATCPADPLKLRWYVAEQRLRNRIDREYGRPTPLSFGPDTAQDIDVRHVLAALERGETVTPSNPLPAPH